MNQLIFAHLHAVSTKIEINMVSIYTGQTVVRQTLAVNVIKQSLNFFSASSASHLILNKYWTSLNTGTYNDTQVEKCKIPGMNLFKCRWNDSKEEEPLAVRYVGSFTPPFTRLPVTVYNITPCRSTIHLTCCFWFSHTFLAACLSISGTPKESVISDITQRRFSESKDMYKSLWEWLLKKLTGKELWLHPGTRFYYKYHLQSHVSVQPFYNELIIPLPFYLFIQSPIGFFDVTRLNNLNNRLCKMKAKQYS